MTSATPAQDPPPEPGVAADAPEATAEHRRLSLVGRSRAVLGKIVAAVQAAHRARVPF
jgi:hypothetical protein